MRRLQHDSDGRTLEQIEATIKFLVRQLQDVAIQREVTLYAKDQPSDDADLGHPHAIECALMDRLASLRRVRTLRLG